MDIFPAELVHHVLLSTSLLPLNATWNLEKLSQNGCRENLQDTLYFGAKKKGFPAIVPLNQSIDKLYVSRLYYQI